MAPADLMPPVVFRWRPRAAGFSPTIATDLENTVDKLFVARRRGSTSPTARQRRPIRARPSARTTPNSILFTPPSTGRLGDGGPDAGHAQRKEGADLLRQRPALSASTTRRSSRPQPTPPSPPTFPFNSIDGARGWWRAGSAGRCHPGIAGRLGMYLGSSAMANATTFSSRQEHAVRAGGDTGGKALLDNNDPVGGNRAGGGRSIGSYYILGYYRLTRLWTGASAGSRLRQRRPIGQTELSPGLLGRQRNSVSSPRWTRNGNSKMR